MEVVNLLSGLTELKNQINLERTKKVKLFAPEVYGEQPYAYFKAPANVIEEVTNGCGSGSNEKMVPDRLLFVSILEACKIHDYMYHFGVTSEDKKLSDEVFLNNMSRLVKAGSYFNYFKKKRLKLAKIYYKYVHYHGGDYFWDSKNREEEYQNVDADKGPLLFRIMEAFRKFFLPDTA